MDLWSRSQSYFRSRDSLPFRPDDPKQVRFHGQMDICTCVLILLYQHCYIHMRPILPYQYFYIHMCPRTTIPIIFVLPTLDAHLFKRTRAGRQCCRLAPPPAQGVSRFPMKLAGNHTRDSIMIPEYRSWAIRVWQGDWHPNFITFSCSSITIFNLVKSQRLLTTASHGSVPISRAPFGHENDVFATYYCSLNASSRTLPWHPMRYRKNKSYP